MFNSLALGVLKEDCGIDSGLMCCWAGALRNESKCRGTEGWLIVVVCVGDVRGRRMN